MNNIKQEGLFISIEGMECAGKTEVLSRLSKNFNEYIYTREPGGIVVAEEIREVIMKNEMSPLTEAYLFASARSEHMIEKVIPSLKQGKTVICDRFVDSSLVYQGIIKGLGIEKVLEINKYAILNRLPDITIFINITIEEMYKRMSNRSEIEITRFDNEKKEFHEKVQKGYLELMRLFPDRFRLVDGMKSKEEVYEQVVNIINNQKKKEILIYEPKVD